MTRTKAINLCRSGTPNADIARKLGVAKGTIGSWKHWDRQRHPDLYPTTRTKIPYCPTCHGAELDKVAYSYLLGLYLGDGNIVMPKPHHVYKMQRLEGVAEPRNHRDNFAMAVRRQAAEVQIGGDDLIEVELWFDVPLGAKVTGLRVEGDSDATGYMDPTPIKHAPDGVLLPMAPTIG